MTDWVERKRTEMYKACIFDLDGTLADTVESIANVANQILERFGAPAQPVEDYKYHAGDGGNVLMERCMKAAGADMSRLEEGQRLYREIFARDPLYKVTVFDGMKETLKELKRRGVKLAVLSNKPHEATYLAVTGLFGSDTFEVIQGLEVGMKKKPDPSGAWKIAKKLFHSVENVCGGRVFMGWRLLIGRRCAGGRGRRRRCRGRGGFRGIRGRC